MIKITRIVILFSMGLITLLGCAPEFKTSYQFEPPQTSEGLSCLMICQRSKDECDLRAIDSDDKCAQKAKKMYLAERQNTALNNEQKPRSLNYLMNSLECRPLQNGHCQEDYRACYKMCGGKVRAHQQCISGTCP